MIWNEFIECMDRERLTKLQGERLHAMVERLYYNVPFYRSKFQENGIEPGDIKSIGQLKDLPLQTNKTYATITLLAYLQSRRQK